MIVFLAIALLAAVLEVVLYMVADFFVGIAIAYSIARFLCELAFFGAHRSKRSNVFSL